MSLSDKKWNGICPVPECNCFHQDENDWLSTRDVKEAIINTQKRLIGELENRKRIHTKKHNRVRTQVLINRIFEEEIGKELCSEVEE